MQRFHVDMCFKTHLPRRCWQAKPFNASIWIDTYWKFRSW